MRTYTGVVGAELQLISVGRGFAFKVLNCLYYCRSYVAITYYRHPEADKRPLFFEIMIPLHKPDFQILKWSDKEEEGEALTLGAPLEKGRHLYRDLQRMYLTQSQEESKDGKTTEKKGIEISAADPERDNIEKEDDLDNAFMDEEGYVLNMEALFLRLNNMMDARKTSCENPADKI